MYRVCGEEECAGRVLYREWGCTTRAGRVLYWKWPGAVLGGRVLCRLGTVRVSSCRPPATHGHRCLALQSLRRCASKPGPSRLSLSDFARNSSMAHSNIEFTSLGLQRFSRILKNDRVKLRAKFGWRWCRRCPWAPQPGPAFQVHPRPSVPPVPSYQMVARVLDRKLGFG